MISKETFTALLAIAILGICLGGCTAPSQLLQSDQQRISGRTFVVTGASSGFGRGVAVKLGAYGSNVVLAARRTKMLKEVAAEVRAAGGTPLVVTTDVSKSDQMERLARAAGTRADCMMVRRAEACSTAVLSHQDGRSTHQSTATKIAISTASSRLSTLAVPRGEGSHSPSQDPGMREVASAPIVPSQHPPHPASPVRGLALTLAHAGTARP